MISNEGHLSRLVTASSCPYVVVTGQGLGGGKTTEQNKRYFILLELTEILLLIERLVTWNENEK